MELMLIGTLHFTGTGVTVLLRFCVGSLACLLSPVFVFSNTLFATILGFSTVKSLAEPLRYRADFPPLFPIPIPDVSRRRSSDPRSGGGMDSVGRGARVQDRRSSW